MSVSEARANLGPATSRTEFAGETTYVTKHGRRSAAIVSASSAELLEQIEELIDFEAVQTALTGDTGDRVPFVRRTRQKS